ncbi:MAG: M1 family metallopeptidase [Desulfobacterales bacterium]|jgi:tricorn protease interacting factor F2/3|nr:M1 family metallopeptidase [Desulfobacterales bacterium]
MTRWTPIHYKIELTPNLATFRFTGQVEILMQTGVGARDIGLNTLALAIWGCRVKIGERWEECPFTTNPEKEMVSIFLPRKMSGAIWVQIEFDGVINNKLGGWYRSGYELDHQARFMAVTQFQESHARQVFPCFDSPEQKATFDITLWVDQHLSAVSNQDIVEERRVAGGKKRVRFRQTPRMSTYLLFLGVGDFDLLVHETDGRVRALSTPGHIQETGFGLAFGEKSLRFCEDYFNIPYPLSKMDLIAIPDFAFGAMENWGAITFRENLLLYDPATTSQAGVARICEVIAHEIVHQWFGNLVSPSDWKYLWLNESFATYTSYDAVDHYYPEWRNWEQFVYHQTASALARDGLFETFPIEIPGGEHVVINTATAPIIYNKGGSILRQIRGYIGDERYRKGLYAYLKKHAYGCADSSDLWNAFEKAAKKPVTALMKSWIEQPGFPLIEAHLEGRELVLTQQRFTYLDQPPNELSTETPPLAARWLIPISIQVMNAVGDSRQMEVLLEDAQVRLDLGADASAVKVNAGQTGFYRVRYANKENLNRLGAHVRSKALGPFDRWGLADDLFALVRRGDARMDDYLDFLKWYDQEDAFLPLMSIADHLLLAGLVLPEAAAKAVTNFGRNFLEALLSRIGYEPAGEEPHVTAILRDHVLYLAAFFESDTAISYGMEKFEIFSAGGAIHPDIMKSAAQVAAMVSPNTAYDQLIRLLEASNSEHERISLLTALGCVRGEAFIQKGIAYTLARVPSRNKHIPLVGFAQNPNAIEWIWKWFEQNNKKMADFHPLILERVVSAIIPLGGMGHEKDVFAYFENDFDKAGVSAGVIRMSLEKLTINVRMRNAHA